MARYCARIRKETAPARQPRCRISMRTRRSGSSPRASKPGTVNPSFSAAVPETGAVPPVPMPPPSTFQFRSLCGAIQLLIFLGLHVYAASLLIIGFQWTSGAAIHLTCGCGPLVSAPPCSWILFRDPDPRQVDSGWAVEAGQHSNMESGLSPFLGSQRHLPGLIHWSCSPALRCMWLYLRLLGAKIGKGGW